MKAQRIPADPYAFLQRVRLQQFFGYALFVIGSVSLVRWMIIGAVSVSDFTQDYLSAQALLRGESIYNIWEKVDFENIRMFSGFKPVYTTPVYNYHTPVLAVLFAGIALLPQDIAFVLWSVMSLLLFLWALRIIRAELQLTFSTSWNTFIVGLLIFWPALHVHVALGQISLVVVACIIGGWQLLRQQREWPAGMLLGLACLIKAFPGLLLLYLVLRQRWRAAAAMMATIVVGGLLTTLIVGLDDVVRYVVHVAPHDVVAYGRYPFNHSLYGAINWLFVDGPWIEPLIALTPHSAILLLWGGRLVVVALLAWHIWRLPHTTASDDVAFALTCLAMLLLSPITWMHIFPLLLLPFALLLRPLIGQPRMREWTLLALTFLIFYLPHIIISTTFLTWFAPGRVPWSATLTLLLPVYGLGLLWWLLVTRCPADPKMQ